MGGEVSSNEARIAIVSDVHGSLTALEAVIADLRRTSPDLVVQAGDLALMGPQPAEVIDRVREFGWPSIAGNTDALLWRPEEHAQQLAQAPRLAPLLRLLFDEYAPFTRDQLTDERIAWLRRLPEQWQLGDLAVVHASPGNLWRAPMPDAPDEELLGVYARAGVTYAAYGHIHRPFVRHVGDGWIANSGSVGMPWDGDPRASYLLIDGPSVEIIRIAYDVERDTALMRSRSHPDAERLNEMRRIGRYVPPPADQ